MEIQLKLNVETRIGFFSQTRIEFIVQGEDIEKVTEHLVPFILPCLFDEEVVREVVSTELTDLKDYKILTVKFPGAK